MAVTITLGLIGLAAFLLVSVYNRLVVLRNRFRNAFSQIDVQLQRRHDLIPNLVETARAYMAHERETLQAVIQARGLAEDARLTARQAPEDGQAIGALGRAETALGGSLMRFMAVAENYPDLKASDTMRALQEELSSTENRVGFARQAFNDAVMRYNTYREQFPNNVIAGFFSRQFQPAEPLAIESEAARQAPRIRF